VAKPVIRAFQAEWIFLRRPRFLVGTFAAVSAVAVLGTLLTMFSVGRKDFNGNAVTASRMALPDGSVQGLESISILIGVVALSIVAAVVGGDYAHGTLRNQLTAQPARLRLLGGKTAALASFLTVLVTVALVVSVLLSLAFAAAGTVDGSAWLGLAGLRQIGEAELNGVISALGYGLLGLLAAMVFRAPAAAIAVGVAYALPFEAIVSRMSVASTHWLPAQLLDALAAGSNGYSVGYLAAGARLALYGVVAVTAIIALFRRRDVVS
jgi:ABC-type transport system involved in multi-copper enzyme maturation permease subunit